MRFVLYYLIFTLLVSSCRKDEYITADPNAKLSLSQQVVLFDTLFTTVGSITKTVKIINRNNDAINITDISLSGGNTSPFSLNINGQSTNSKPNIKINGQDSLNIFVRVNINPDTRTNPFIIQDSIIIQSNGNRQAIQLIAYGQNAIFINNGTINSNTVWYKGFPYIITGSITINNNATLTVSPGTKIYFHKDAVMNVEGKLSVNGTASEPILFSSDRMEDIYANQPGQWQGIYMKRFGNGIINNAVIKNASVGITSDSLSNTSNPKLIVANTIIKNMQVAAFIGYHSELLAFNNLMYNCGNYLIYAIGGGNYNLKQNTFAGYNPNFPRKNAALTFSDYISATSFNKLQLNLTNNIIWGSLNNELDIQKKTNAANELTIVNNLIKTTSNNYNTSNNTTNVDPHFLFTTQENFELSSGSPALAKGISLTTDEYYNIYLSKDLKNNNRTFPSTLGCYEKK
ncbi:hypothetical protein QWY86_11300 [Pedobacter aquatilis]|uniref:hypothetical protein n=1 Tax=Pedobacter aquatilis TaxID=351343 RepID=UPI0025B30D69|nr:hypothetical protein [Pedobacter aquatilis]MDN3587257.1 hypothetical protein [Pedobacter aquatilis]